MNLWRGLLDTLDRYPWDMPYRIMLDKLGASRIVESLSLGIVGEVVETLLPSDAGGWMLPPPPSNGRAPGPDGIIGRVIRSIRSTSDILVKRWMSCFTACRREGVFPSRWKMARLVLLKKPGKSFFFLLTEGKCLTHTPGLGGKPGVMWGLHPLKPLRVSLPGHS